jgi:hypothetical protein
MGFGPPNLLYDLAIGTPPLRWFARQVYFNRRPPVAPPRSGDG